MARVRITKFGHACVRIERDARALVIDPGNQTEPEAVDGAHGVLVTHEHADHWDAELLRRTDAPIFTIGAVADELVRQAPDLAERIVRIEQPADLGARFEQVFEGALSVRAVGVQHAVIHPEFPALANSGYLVTGGGTTLFHPGDSLTHPGVGVDVLCVPVSAPWLKASEAVDFARTVRAPRNLAIHDRVYSEFGLGIMDGHFARFLPALGLDYVRLTEGADL